MKRRLYLLATLLLLQATLYSQIVTAEYILGGKILRQAAYTPDKPGGSTYKLGFDYGESVLLNKNVAKQIAKESVLKIDFVYSRYKETSDFDQRTLNEKRINALVELVPSLFENTSIEWRVIEIAALPTKEENEKLFHGFVIYTKPYVSFKDGMIVASDKPFKKGSEAAGLSAKMSSCDCYTTEKQMKLKKKKKKGEWTGAYLPKSANKRASGIRYESKSIWGRKKEYAREEYYDTVWVSVSVPDTSTPECLKKVREVAELKSMEETAAPFAYVNMVTADSVVSAALNRNKQWKKIIIVQDVTGSMAPYTQQTLLWRRLNDKATRAKQFVFFNDGDSKPDGPVGRSGGAYYIKAADNGKVETTCTGTMLKGGGGMGPENNIEAIVYAQKQNEEAAEIVMIADNWAPVRDMRLLDQVKVPVHVIVCGAWTGQINIDYLNIALATGGSVHTIEKDFNDLAKLTEGEVLEVGGQKYKVKDGRFVLTR